MSSAISGFLRTWKATLVAGLLVLPPCIAMLILLPQESPRTLVLASGATREMVVAARDEAMARSTSFEQLLVALGSLELGIVAYVAGVVLGKDAKIDRPRLFFGLFAALTFITTVTYLHTLRVYLGYGAYAVQLEMSKLEPGLRPTSHVFAWASSPNVPAVLSPAVALAGSLEIVSLYPVFILAAAIVAFGRRLEIAWDWVVGLALAAFGWAFMYTFPSMIEFIQLVQRCNAGP